MIQVHIRIPEEVHAAAFEAAHDARKSLSAWIGDLIRERVEQNA